MKRFSCDESVELVTAYLEDELDELTRDRFEEHLVACEGCARHLAQSRTTVVALGELRPQGLPGDMRERLLTAFRERRHP
ncbi:anti-sigma factor RsiW [Streptosporangium album]|uniref:Anti-sigma factor RsiW n=1 Tax=Streptosporangium album TaxID=47479 RepID=A0A7W7W9C5_9ACTN|nr:anti-sigma factor [Streptosporangium album]MBB4938746.1 anti-sigma factor RsiW [Streptosporangium album]